MSDEQEPYDFRTQRLFVDEPLASEKPLEANKQQSNYLLNVLRMKAGDELLLFNGRDGEWRARIELQSKKKAQLLPFIQTRSQPEPLKLKYCFAPLKQARLDYMVQKAVEMGAGELCPVITHHTQVSRLNVERMKANAIEAAEQCGVLSPVQCHEPIKLARFLDQWNPDETLIFCDEAIGNQTAIETLNKLDAVPAGVLIGPEGGFSPQERNHLRALDFIVPISLGPRILRADTAAVSALTVIQASRGDWR